LKHPLSKPQKEIYDYFCEFYKRYPEHRSPTLRDMATGQVDGIQVCKERASRQSIYPHVRTLIDKGYIKEKFYRNKPYWILAEADDE
tara:strand:- start:17229 stop:17489 length:261 start_codon:yes stop_codon:yes gene_type:complete